MKKTGHVILLRMTSETLGIPSMIEDDPVMALAMPDGDGFMFSEERRLFYVAMTRAKRSVRLITLTKRESDFVMELIKHHRLPVRDSAGEVREEELYPECGRGFLVTRKGPYGAFLVCSNFPPCRYKKKLPKPEAGSSTSRRFQPQNEKLKTRRLLRLHKRRLWIRLDVCRVGSESRQSQ